MTEPETEGLTAVIRVTGMHCATCVATLEKALRAVDGVYEVSVSLATGKAAVRYNPRIRAQSTIWMRPSPVLAMASSARPCRFVSEAFTAPPVSPP